MKIMTELIRYITIAKYENLQHEQVRIHDNRGIFWSQIWFGGFN